MKIIKCCWVYAGTLCQVFTAGDADFNFSISAAPNWDGTTPETIPGNGPVASPGYPVVEAFVLNKVGYPLRLHVVSLHAILYALNTHEPARDRLVDQRRVGTVAEWVTMLYRTLLQEAPTGLQILHDFAVGVLNINSLVIRYVSSEAPTLVNGANNGRISADNTMS